MNCFKIDSRYNKLKYAVNAKIVVVFFLLTRKILYSFQLTSITIFIYNYCNNINRKPSQTVLFVIHYGLFKENHSKWMKIVCCNGV